MIPKIAAIIASDEMSEHIRLTIKTTLKLDFGSASSSSLTDATQAVQISDYRQHHGPLRRRLLGSWRVVEVVVVDVGVVLIFSFL